MANYVLTSGLVTTDVVVYIQDYFRLKLLLIKNEIPLNPSGIDKNIDEVELPKIKEALSDRINGIIESLIPTLAVKITIKLESINIEASSTIVKININGTTTNYGLSTRNKN